MDRREGGTSVALGVAFGVGNLLLFAARPLLPGRGRIYAPPRSLAWFALGGVFNLLAALCFMTALTFGEVSTILPVSRLTPLWVVIFSSIFFRRLERITGLIVLAALLVVAGGIMVSLR
jgi:uncharacterized membrane protein